MRTPSYADRERIRQHTGETVRVVYEATGIASGDRSVSSLEPGS